MTDLISYVSIGASGGIVAGALLLSVCILTYHKGWKDRGEQEATFARIDELKRIEQEHQQCLAKQETPKP